MTHVEEVLCRRVMALPSTFLGIPSSAPPSSTPAAGAALGPQSGELVRRCRTLAIRLPSACEIFSTATAGMQRIEEKVMHQPTALAQPG